MLACGCKPSSVTAEAILPHSVRGLGQAGIVQELGAFIRPRRTRDTGLGLTPITRGQGRGDFELNCWDRRRAARRLASTDPASVRIARLEADIRTAAAARTNYRRGA